MFMCRGERARIKGEGETVRSRGDVAWVLEDGGERL